MEAQVSLTVAFSSSAFFGLLFLIFLLTIPHRCHGQFLPEPKFEPTTSGYKSNALSIRPRLPLRTGVVMSVFKKHNGPTPADDIAHQMIQTVET